MSHSLLTTAEKIGTIDGNRTRLCFIDSEVSPPGGLYGIKLVRPAGLEPASNWLRARYTYRCTMDAKMIIATVAIKLGEPSEIRTRVDALKEHRPDH